MVASLFQLSSFVSAQRHGSLDNPDGIYNPILVELTTIKLTEEIKWYTINKKMWDRRIYKKENTEKWIQRSEV